MLAVHLRLSACRSKRRGVEQNGPFLRLKSGQINNLALSWKEKALANSATAKSPEDRGKQLKWITAEFFPW